MPQFEVAEAQLVALFLETAFYGIFLATFCECLRALLWHKDSFRAKSGVRWMLLAVAVSMCLIGTTDVLLNLQHNLEAFIFYTGPGGATAEFHDISYWINVVRGVTLALQMMIGDAMLVYRIYMVYARNIWVTIPPFLLWLGLCVALMAIPYSEAAIKGQALLTVTALNNWTNATVILTLVLNVLGTAMISFRIWSISRRTRLVTPLTPTTRTARLPASPVSYAMRIIIESGLIYTISIVILFVSSFTQSNSIYGVSDAVVQIIGICFNLIILRVDWLTSGPGTTSTEMSSQPVQLRSFKSMQRQTMTPMTVSQVEVKVNRDVESDGGIDIVADTKGDSGESWVE